tara:strand:+ start:3620 stop:4612 length:993 start_codon:yes stop_codon:yes gene_type:complete
MEANSPEQVTTPTEAPQAVQVTPDVPAFEQEIAAEATPEPQGTTFEEIVGVTPNPTEQNGEAPASNDQVRYGYWQSEAAKLKNQLAEKDEILRQQTPVIEYVTQNPGVLQNGQAPVVAQPQQQPQAPQVEEAKEEFPPPPLKPERPVAYSREDAYSDPASESAQYDATVEQWRDDMQTYNQLHTSYQVASLQENHDKEIANLRKFEDMRQADARQRAELDNARRYVKSRYDLGSEANLDSFIQEMNDPNSVNMDDLVGYWKHKNGIVDNAPLSNSPQVPQQGSPTFEQLKRAQSVPTPMGVQTSAGNQAADPSNNFMSSLISEEKNRNLL